MGSRVQALGLLLKKAALPLLVTIAVIVLVVILLCSRGGAGYFPVKGEMRANIDTHLEITFREVPEVGESGFIRIFDASTGECVDSLDLSLPAGHTEPRTYAPDIDYPKVPYDYARDIVPTNRNTVPGTPSGTAEPTPRDMQLTIIGGFTDGFHFHPVLVRGKTAVIYPHNNVLEYGHRYCVTIDEGVLLCGKYKGEKHWRFSTKASGPADPRRLSVNADGSADFNTLQGALDAVPDFCPDTTWIRVAAGDYEEIVYTRNKTNLVIQGSGKEKTLVHYANNEVFNPHPLTLKNNEKKGTFPYRRAAVSFDNCTGVVLKDISFATDLKGQAEGLLLNGDRIELYRVGITGSGDALQANGTIYLEDVEITGDGDTILGRGSIYAYHSTIRNHGGPLSWVRNFKPAHGNVFVECLLESVNPDKPADYGRTGNNHGATYPDAETVLLNCTTRNFLPAGWSIIGMPSATMLELQTRDADSGDLVDVSQRHPYSRQLDPVKDAALIAKYRDPAFVLAGWQPR